MKIKILLADDDEDDRMLFANVLKKRSDIELLPSAVSGVNAIELLDKMEDINLPDLIILDQNMPMMNGKQTLSFLKSSKRYAAIPIIVYSTYIDGQLKQECIQLGASKVAAKPMSVDGYHKMMDDFLNIFSGQD